MFILLFTLVMVAAASFGMMGLGSGIYYVPLLSWFGLDFATGAVPFGLLLSFFTGAGTAHTYFKGDHIHLNTGFLAALTVLAGAPLGVRALHWAPIGIVKLLLSAAAFYIGVRALRSADPVCHTDRPYAINIGLTLLMGFIMGFFSALIGVGGGFLLTPVLLTCGFPTREAVGTTSLVVTIGALISFLFHLPTAHFSLQMAVPLCLGALVGAKLGGMWATRIAHPKTLRTIVASSIILIAIKVGWEGVAAMIK
jgi:uncharacterized membrane protein YfcA